MDVHHICCFIVFSIYFLFIFLLMIIFMFYRTTIMPLVSPLFLASVASLTLTMTTIDATIKLLQQMKILPTTGTCSSCYSSSGSYKTEGLYHYFRCTTCKKKPFCTTLCWAIATHCCTTLFCSCTNSATVIGPTILWSRRRFYLKRDTRRNICQGKRSTSGSRTSGCCAWGRRRAALQKLEERGTWSSWTRACHTAPESVKRVKSSA